MKLGKSPVEVPRVGLGVMTWGEAPRFTLFNPARQAYGGTEGRESEATALAASLTAGVNFLDTAEMYSNGGSETRLGELARDPGILIATKFPPSPFSNPEKLLQDLEGSLTRLRRSQVALFQHHFPTSTKSIPRIMNLLADAFDAGKIRAAGVSNYSEAQMRLAHRVLADRGIPLASNQVQYSLLHRRPETNGVLEACRELGVTLIAYQPLASGALTGKYDRNHRPKGLRSWVLPYFRSSAQKDLERVVGLLREIGARHDKNPSQVALRWLLEHPEVLPIPGAKNAEQARSNAAALTFRLSADEVGELSRVSERWMK